MTTLTESKSGSGSSTLISNCKGGSDHLPEYIYASNKETKGGNEDFISREGSYHIFKSDVPITAQNGQWLHTIEIDVPSNSLL